MFHLSFLKNRTILHQKSKKSLILKYYDYDLGIMKVQVLICSENENYYRQWPR